MEYRFTADRDWSDFSNGRVLRGRPGQPAFPVRLANEIFQLSAEACEKIGHVKPFTIYDPCCGGGYSLTVIGLLNAASVANVLASDVNETALEIAEKNLLCSPWMA